MIYNGRNFSIDHMPRACIVEPIGNDGVTSSGLVVVNNTAPLSFGWTSKVRVLEKGRGCLYPLKVGAVYVIGLHSVIFHQFPNFTLCVTHEQNLMAEIEGYDD